MASSKPKSCPLCAKPESSEFAPFCSAGCKDRDLLQWLDEGYKVPGPAVSPDQLADHFAGETGRDGES
ncbi:DNA gyrase inhibitor YacG [Parasphingorhabdus sp.]|uniref:DNA gyrase inhibitor YacG n=1 Tax=Parasphingorhabdus sp. TaxID=2709688 RepID=UPI0032654D38